MKKQLKPARRQSLNIHHRGTLVINVGSRTQIKITMTAIPRRKGKPA